MAVAQLRRADPQRAEERDAVARAAPVAFGHDDVDVAKHRERFGQRSQRVRVDPVVVRDEDVPATAHSRFGARSVPRAPRGRRVAPVLSRASAAAEAASRSAMSVRASVRARRPRATSYAYRANVFTMPATGTARNTPQNPASF